MEFVMTLVLQELRTPRRKRGGVPAVALQVTDPEALPLWLGFDPSWPWTTWLRHFHPWGVDHAFSTMEKSNAEVLAFKYSQGKQLCVLYFVSTLPSETIGSLFNDWERLTIFMVALLLFLSPTYSPAYENQQLVDSRERSSRCWGKEITMICLFPLK